MKENDAIDCFSKILLPDANNNYALVSMGDKLKAVEIPEDFQMTGVKNKKITEIYKSI